MKTRAVTAASRNVHTVAANMMLDAPAVECEAEEGAEHKVEGFSVKHLRAGLAIFTLRSLKTRTRFTYKVSTTENGAVLIGVLTGPENTASYTYLGMLTEENTIRLTRGSKITEAAPSYKALAWFVEMLAHKIDYSKVCEVWHAGRCLVCGRTLTTPESIQIGIGPNCQESLSCLYLV
jgi:hypothetical protein